MKVSALLTLAFALCACTQNQMSLAKVNGESISVGDFKSRLAEIQFDSKFVAEDELLALKKSILNEMIEERITKQEASASNIKVSDDDVKKASEMIENLDQALADQKISKDYWNDRTKQKLIAEKLFNEITKTAIPPTEAEIKDIFDKNPKIFHQDEQVHLQQIVMKTKDQAAEVQKKLIAGEDFQALGGIDLGFIGRGILPEDAEKKIFSMKTALSPIIQEDENFSIYKVVERKEDKLLAFEEARQRIESMLLQKAKETLYSQWLQDKMIHAKIKRNYELLQENIHP